MYHRCLERIVDEREQRGSSEVSVMVASHNVINFFFFLIC